MGLTPIRGRVQAADSSATSRRCRSRLCRASESRQFPTKLDCLTTTDERRSSAKPTSRGRAAPPPRRSARAPGAAHRSSAAQHPLGVPLIGLDLALRRALDLSGRRHQAPDPRRLERASEPYPVGPASYAARVGPGSAARNSTTLAVSPGSLRERSSPDCASNVTASTLRACTSRPAQLRTFAMGRRSFRMGLSATRRGRHPRRVITHIRSSVTRRTSSRE